MKKISEHLGQIIVALAGVALLIAACVVFREPIGDFYNSIVSKETAVGDSIFATMEDINLSDLSGNPGQKPGQSSEIDPALYAPIVSPYAPDNMFDASTLIPGSALNLNGVNGVVSAATHSATPEIPVEAGKDYIVRLTAATNGVSCRTMCILEDGTVTYPFTGKAYSSSDSVLTMPENCKFIRFSAVTEQIQFIEFVPAPTIKVAVNGDSITKLSYGWAKHLSQYFYFDFTNHAVDGSKLAVYNGTGTVPSSENSLINRYTKMDTDADICMIAIGSNDWWHSWDPIGTDEDTSTSTFRGALHTVCRGLKEMYGDKPIVFLTPLKRDADPNMVNKWGYTLEDYANAIIDVCAQYDIYVIDIFRDCPVDPSIPEHQYLFFNGIHNETEGYPNQFNDTTHPNLYGARVQARYAIEALKEILRIEGLL